MILLKKNHDLNTLLDELTDELGRDTLAYINPRVHLVKSNLWKDAPGFSSKINTGLVIMETVGREGIAGFYMGNTEESIFNQLDCLVLAVKPQKFLFRLLFEWMR